MFTFNGISKKYIRVLRDFTRPSWAPVELDIANLPGRAGGYLVSKKRKVRVINVPVEMRRYENLDLQKTKEDIAAWLNTDSPAPLVFSDEPDRTYYAMLSGELDVDEILNKGKGVITFICPDSNKYGMEKTLNGLSVINNGTTDTPFKLKMVATAPATYLSISNGEKSLGIGKPASDKFVEELKFHDSMDSLNGWTPIPTLLTDYLEVGAITVINGGGYYGNVFELRNVTTEGAGWRGRSIVKSVGTVQDYRVEGVFEIIKILGEVGKIRQFLLLIDALGKEVGRIGVSFDGNGSRFEVRLGNDAVNYVIMDSLGHAFTYDEGVFCKIILSKKGNVYRTSVIRVDKQSGVEIKEELTTFYTDVLNIYSSNGVSAVAYHASQQKHQLKRLYDIKIYEYVDENTLNPNVVTVGDVIEIDTDAQLIFINGQIRKQYKSIESDYFNLRSGKNQLFVYPNVTENHEITLRERYL